MTLREKMILGTLATILGKTDLLASLCMQSATAEGVQGEMITIDPAAHRKLHIIPFGEHREGSACVLMEGGLGQSAENWQKTMNLISHDTYGLSYSRAGQGLSDSSPRVGSIEEILEDFTKMISTLEREGKIQKPYILVGHSFGGIIMQIYAKMHPGDIKGIVLVDSSSDLSPEEKNKLELIDFHEELMPRKTEELLFPLSRDSATFFEEDRNFYKNMSVLRDMIQLHEASSQEPFLGKIPLQVLTQHPEDPEERKEREWQELQRKIFLRSSNATWTGAQKGVGHNIEEDDPQLVAQAIKSLL